MAGSVLGMATTAVKPPSAAARAAALDGLRFFLTGLAEVGVQVDESGRDDAPVGSSMFGRGEVGADRDDAPVVADDHVGVARSPVGIDHPAAFENGVAHRSSPSATPEPSNQYKTAMRTATPFRTWSMITEPRHLGDVGRDLDASVHRARDA